MEAIAAVAELPEGFAKGDLGRGVLSPVRAHDARDGFGLWLGRSFVADIFDDGYFIRDVADATGKRFRFVSVG